GSDKHPESFKHHNINGEDSNSTMIDPEPNLMDSSIHINTKNAGSHHEKNFDNNDDFFQGLDDFFDKSMAHSTIGTSVVQAYKPSAFITESQSHNKFIGNGSSIVTDKASEYNPIGYENDEFYKNVEPLSIFVKIAWREIKENNFEYPHYLTDETKERFNLKLTGNLLESGQQFVGKTDGYDNFHFTQHDIIEEQLGGTKYFLEISINGHNVRLHFLRGDGKGDLTKTVLCTSAIYEKGINFYEINFGTEKRNPSCILVDNSTEVRKDLKELKLKEKCIYNSTSEEIVQNKIDKIFAQNFANGKNKKEKILKLLCEMYKKEKCAAAVVDNVNYEFDLNVINNQKPERYVTTHCVDKKRKEIVENNTSHVSKKSKGINNIAHNLNKVTNTHNLGSLYQRNFMESNLANNHPEINLMNPSMITNENKNQESNHVTNIHDNDDFFDGLDDYLESTMGSTHSSVDESQSSSNSIGNNIMTNEASEYDPIPDNNFTKNDKNIHSMEADDMLEDDLKFIWKNDEPQNLSKVLL
uniref:Uncharacterized protein n=1 Tax=Meloidogyne floridensis TaxID=298350 RepID=A0A915NND9_9BILA